MLLDAIYANSPMNTSVPFELPEDIKKLVNEAQSEAERLGVEVGRVLEVRVFFCGVLKMECLLMIIFRVKRRHARNERRESWRKLLKVQMLLTEQSFVGGVQRAT